MKEPVYSNFNSVIHQYRKNAEKRGLCFDITADKFKELTSLKCYYCGTEPSRIREKCKNKKFVYNGIDRVDNFTGYTDSNCVPCCSSCNIAKHTMTSIEFLSLIKKIYKNRNLGSEDC